MTKKSKIGISIFALIILVILFFMLPLLVGGPIVDKWSDQLPIGWQRFERTPEQRCFDQGASDGNKVETDIDGDGIPDVGTILKNHAGEYALFVYLSRKHRYVEVKEFGKEVGPTYLKLLKPGTYTTACGKGHWECKPEEPSSVFFAEAPISIIFCESSSSVLLWEAKTQRVVEFWLSD